MEFYNVQMRNVIQIIKLFICIILIIVIIKLLIAIPLASMNQQQLIIIIGQQ